MRIKNRPSIIQFFLIAGIIFIIVYLLSGLFAGTASGYYSEIVLMILPPQWHERRLFDVMFLELIPLWIVIGALSAIYVGYRWNPLEI